MAAATAHPGRPWRLVTGRPVVARVNLLRML